jgi:hypothetical protein
VFDRVPKIKGPCIVVRWRIGRPPRPGFLEVTWPRLPPRRPIRRLVDASGALAKSRAAQLWGLWTHDVHAPMPGGGRPRKGRLWDRQDYIEWYQSYVLDGERPTLRALGKDMGVSDDTAGKRVHEAELPWPPEAHLEVWEPDG